MMPSIRISNTTEKWEGLETMLLPLKIDVHISHHYPDLL